MEKLSNIPIIFLDIDGVLNCQSERGQHGPDNLNRRCIDDLKKSLLDKVPGCKIVISSTWRLWKTLEELQDVFENHGISRDIIIGFTDDLPGIPRGVEILKFCQKHDVTNYVIIDDDSDMLLWQASRFISVDCYCGLTGNSAYRAKRVLTGEAGL